MTEPDQHNPYAPPASGPDVAGYTDAEPPPDISNDLVHVHSAVKFAILEKQQHEDDAVQIDAVEICQMVLSLACRMTPHDRTGKEAFAYLGEMNLRRSEDVGRAIDELDRLGVTRPTQNDHPDDFYRLYHLETDASTWRIAFDMEAEMTFAMTPDDAVRLLIDQISDTPPPFTPDEIMAGLAMRKVHGETAARTYSFALIACGRILIKDIGATFSNDYFCFSADGDVVETGKLDESPYFLATNEFVSQHNIGHPSLSHFATTSADVRAINDLLNRGSDPRNIVTTPSIVFLASPTSAGMLKAQKTIAQFNAEGIRQSRSARPWWKFW